MANTKISALTPGSPAQASDVFPIDRAGANNSLKASDLSAISTAQNLGGEFVALDMGYGSLAASTNQVCSAANVVDAVMFIQKYTQTFTRMSLRLGTTFGASSHFGMAIYDSTGARITNATTGALDGTNVASVQTVTVTAVTLTPGIYYLGWSTDGATSGRAFGILLPSSNANITQFINSARGNKLVTGATVSAAGVPPATLGALSSNVSTVHIPGLWIEP